MINNLSPEMTRKKAMEILRDYENHVGGIESYCGGPLGRIKWMINPPGEYLKKVQQNINSMLVSVPPSEEMDGSDPLYRGVELLDRRINLLLENKRFPEWARHKTYDLD